MSDSVRPHRRQPTRLPHPWDPPGKNTGVGCHFLLQCMKVKSESEVAQSCLILCHPMDCSLPGSSIHGIFQARVLEWGATAFSEARAGAFPLDLGARPLCRRLRGRGCSVVDNVSLGPRLPPSGSGCLSPEGEGLQPAISVQSFVPCAGLAVS